MALEKDEHQKLLLAMEFRNQFMHNAFCNSFVAAVEILNRKKELLQFVELNIHDDDEANFKSAYQNLFINCLDIILSKYDRRRAYLADRRSIVTNISKYSKLVVDQDTQLLSDIMEACLPTIDDSPDVLNFKFKLSEIISEGSNKINESVGIMSFKIEIDRILDDKDTIRKFFS